MARRFDRAHVVERVATQLFIFGVGEGNPATATIGGAGDHLPRVVDEAHDVFVVGHLRLNADDFDARNWTALVGRVVTFALAQPIEAGFAHRTLCVRGAAGLLFEGADGADLEDRLLAELDAAAHGLGSAARSI